MNERKPNQTLATTSLVVGIFSLLCGFFLGIPAIGMGHVALKSARQSPELFGGVEKAKAGLVLGYLSSFVSIVWLLLALRGATTIAHSNKCSNNMKQIGIAVRLWPKDGGDGYSHAYPVG